MADFAFLRPEAATATPAPVKASLQERQAVRRVAPSARPARGWPAGTFSTVTGSTTGQLASTSPPAAATASAAAFNSRSPRLHASPPGPACCRVRVRFARWRRTASVASFSMVLSRAWITPGLHGFPRSWFPVPQPPKPPPSGDFRRCHQNANPGPPLWRVLSRSPRGFTANPAAKSRRDRSATLSPSPSEPHS